MRTPLYCLVIEGTRLQLKDLINKEILNCKGGSTWLCLHGRSARPPAEAFYWFVLDRVDSGTLFTLMAAALEGRRNWNVTSWRCFVGITTVTGTESSNRAFFFFLPWEDFLNKSVDTLGCTLVRTSCHDLISDNSVEKLNVGFQKGQDESQDSYCEHCKIHFCRGRSYFPGVGVWR